MSTAANMSKIPSPEGNHGTRKRGRRVLETHRISSPCARSCRCAVTESDELVGCVHGEKQPVALRRLWAKHHGSGFRIARPVGASTSARQQAGCWESRRRNLARQPTVWQFGHPTHRRAPDGADSGSRTEILPHETRTDRAERQASLSAGVQTLPLCASSAAC